MLRPEGQCLFQDELPLLQGLVWQAIDQIQDLREMFWGYQARSSASLTIIIILMVLSRFKVFPGLNNCLTITIAVE